MSINQKIGYCNTKYTQKLEPGLVALYKARRRSGHSHLMDANFDRVEMEYQQMETAGLDTLEVGVRKSKKKVYIQG